MLRESYYANLRGEKANVYGEAFLEETEREHLHKTHIGHCFDYIRQAIMCSGDMTLEGAMRLPSGELGPSVDGWGATHQCRSWDGVMAFMNENKAPNNHSGIA